MDCKIPDEDEDDKNDDDDDDDKEDDDDDEDEVLGIALSRDSLRRNHVIHRKKLV